MNHPSIAIIIANNIEYIYPAMGWFVFILDGVSLRKFAMEVNSFTMTDNNRITTMAIMIKRINIVLG